MADLHLKTSAPRGTSGQAKGQLLDTLTRDQCQMTYLVKRRLVGLSRVCMPALARL